MQEAIGQIKNLIVVLIRPSEEITRVLAVSMEVIRTCLVVTTIIQIVKLHINLHVVIIHHLSQVTAVLKTTGVILNRLRVTVVLAAVVVVAVATAVVAQVAVGLVVLGILQIVKLLVQVVFVRGHDI